MRYLPTLDLWHPAISEAVRTGQMKLQCGQWVTCGGKEKHRFVGATPRTMVVAHPEGRKTPSRERFKSLREYYKSIKK